MAGSLDPIGDGLRADAVAYWRFDEASGMRVDATGRGNDLTDFLSNISGVAGLVNGAAGMDALISDVGKGLGHDENTDLRMYNKNYYYLWTWINPQAAQYGEFFNLWDINDNEEFALEVSDASDNWIKFGFSCGNNGSVVNPVQANVGDWHLVEIYYRKSPEQIGIAVDNGVFSVDNTVNLMAAANSPFAVGAMFASGLAIVSPYNFLCDETGIMNRLPTSDERDYLWNDGSGRTLFP